MMSLASRMLAENASRQRVLSVFGSPPPFGSAGPVPAKGWYSPYYHLSAGWDLQFVFWDDCLRQVHQVSIGY